MAHKSKYRRMCGISKSQSCYNCLHKVHIAEDKKTVKVTCGYRDSERVLEFPRHIEPYCAAWRESYKEQK